MAAVTAIVDKQYSPTEYDRGYNEVSLLFATCHNRQITDNWGVRRHHRRGIKKITNLLPITNSRSDDSFNPTVFHVYH